MSLDKSPLVSDWLSVAEGRIVVHSGKVDIGQRISTAVASIAAHELALPPDLVACAPVRTGESPDEGMTSGSNSIEQSGHAIRCAAATLRAAVLAWAAESSGASADWDIEDGAVRGPGTNRRVPLPEFLEGRDLAIPVDPDPALWRTPGKAVALPMAGIEALVTGAYRFVHDIDVPDMLHARVVRPPHSRARLEAVDPARVEALEQAGLHVLRDGSFLALAGVPEWTVVTAAERLAAACTWDIVDGLPEEDSCARLVTGNARRLVVRDGTPHDEPVPDPLPEPDFSARYERPFTLHGALAPSAAFALWDGDRLEISTHSQGIYPLRAAIAESLGMAPDKVVLTHVPGSGCYGHNGADDAAFDAALVARALPGRPVLLKWSRADEHGWEPFGTAMAIELAARLAPDGRVAAYSAEAIGGTFRGRPRSGPNRAGPASLLANHHRADAVPPRPVTPNMGRHAGMHRNLPPIYDFPETRLIKNLVADLPHRTSALRCLGAAANVFALESFVDQIARDAGADPIAFRRRHLSDPEDRAVLDALAADLRRAPAPPEGAGRGIAYAQYKNAMTRVAVAVDLAVTDRAEIQLLHIRIVADAGRVIDRDGLTAQLEGGALQAASWALHEEVTWDRSGITSRDWETYHVLRFDEVPKIAVTILENQHAPARGAGEAAPGPTLAAIANALFDATGLRVRRLPFTPERITAVALNA